MRFKLLKKLQKRQFSPVVLEKIDALCFFKLAFYTAKTPTAKRGMEQVFVLYLVIIQLGTEHGKSAHEPKAQAHLGIEIDMICKAADGNAHRG